MKMSVKNTSGEIYIPELDAKIITHKPRNKAWSSEEDAIITKYYNNIPARDLAEYLGRTIASVRMHAEFLGLQKRSE